MGEFFVDEDVKHGFRVGDRVVFVADEDPDMGVVFGQTGTVCNINDSFREDSIGVEWDKEKMKYHDCAGKSREHHGWWVPYNEIEKLVVDLGEIETSDITVDSLFALTE